jgi:mono/diheme cytochrome c family protein
MPPLIDLLGPAQIAAVVTYVRTHFRKSYKKPVTEADVKLMMAP